MNISIDFKWEPVFIRESEHYYFPNEISDFMRRKYKAPAIYRWVVEKDGKIVSMYVGEADELCPRRIYGYLNPGPSQMTNIRINDLFHQLISQGNKIWLEHLVLSSFIFDGKTITPSDLGKKTVRMFLENLILIHYESSGITILNQAVKSK